VRVTRRTAAPRASRRAVGRGSRGAKASRRLRRGDSRGSRRPVELLEVLDGVGIRAAPVARGETASGGGDQEKEHEELAARVEGHGSTIPPARRRD
jgi:hypothetical protein